nr:integrase, catalytic region, zinc finger, CCHC-type, peptidase aspartic, catalytic [Tanacetum cinerariifolium]
MKLKANIGIFIGYSESSRGFRIYNRQTKKIMETLHFKFNELTAMASECNNSEPGFNYMNFQDSSKIITNLEVAFRSNTCYVRNLKGDDLLTGSRESNLYTISISELAASSPVCLMSKATSTKSWLWHRRLSYLNFGTINQLTSNDIVDGFSKFKYNKDHLCLAREQGKSKKASLPPKLVLSTELKLELLHVDLCGPMRVASINGKKYILVIVDDFSWYTWLGIVHNTLITQTPQQNGFVERRNRILVEAARTMVIFYKSSEFIWAEAIATACFTHNRSIVHTRYNKTPYELIYGTKPNVQYFYVFRSLCYPINDRDDLGKIKLKANIGIFIGYSESSREYYATSPPEVSDNFTAHTLDNDDTSSSSSIVVEKDEAPQIVSSSTEQVIMETIHVKFDELTTMASEHDCLEPELQRVNNHISSAEPMNTPSKKDLDNLFGSMFKEYFGKKSSDTSINSAAQPTHFHEDSPSTSSINVEEHEAPPIETTSNEETSQIS